MREHHASHHWENGKCSRCHIAAMDCECEPESGCSRKLECIGEPHPALNPATVKVTAVKFGGRWLR